MVTNAVIWDGQWTPAQEFKAVISPEIKGYTPDKPVKFNALTMTQPTLNS